jgi:hypothetical protein
MRAKPGTNAWAAVLITDHRLLSPPPVAVRLRVSVDLLCLHLA